MGLSVLPMQRMLLIRVVAIDALVPAGSSAVGLHVLPVLRQLDVVHLFELLKCHLDVGDKGITSTTGEVLAHNHAHHLQLVSIRGHGVGRYYPAALAQLVRDGELVELMAVSGVEAEGDQGQAGAMSFRHEDETHLLHASGQVVGRAG